MWGLRRARHHVRTTEWSSHFHNSTAYDIDTPTSTPFIYSCPLEDCRGWIWPVCGFAPVRSHLVLLCSCECIFKVSRGIVIMVSEKTYTWTGPGALFLFNIPFWTVLYIIKTL